MKGGVYWYVCLDTLTFNAESYKTSSNSYTVHVMHDQSAIEITSKSIAKY